MGHSGHERHFIPPPKARDTSFPLYGMMMKWSLFIQLVTLLGLLGSPLISAETPRSKFEAIAAKNGGNIVLDSTLFDELVALPRDYSVSVLLNALAPQYKCHVCQLLAPEHRLVASQYAKQNPERKHFYAELDFTKGYKTFQRYGLQTAPVLLVFGPDSNSPVRFDTNAFGIPSAEAYANLIKNAAGLDYEFKRPFNYGRLFTILGNLFGVLVLVYFTQNFWLSFFSARYIYVVFSLFTIIVMNSGYMWNRIRLPRFSGVENGKVRYFEGGFQTQFAGESLWMSALYAANALAVIVLVVMAPKMKDPLKQKFIIYLWTFGAFLFASSLYRIFQIKQPMCE